MCLKKIFIGLLVFLHFGFLSYDSVAEEVNFFKRVWRRFYKKEERKEQPKEDVSIRDTVASEDVMPSKGELSKVEREPPSREAMIDSINKDLDIWGEVLSGRIPNVAKKTDEEGKHFFQYRNSSGEELELTGLDDDTLTGLFRKVNREAGLLRTQRLNKQLQRIQQLNRQMRQERQRRQMQQMRNLRRTTRIPKPVRPVPKPVKTYTPPRVPKTPTRR